MRERKVRTKKHEKTLLRASSAIVGSVIGSISCLQLLVAISSPLKAIQKPDRLSFHAHKFSDFC